MLSPAPLANLDMERLDALARSLRSGTLREWIDTESVARILGPNSGAVSSFLLAAGNEGLSKDALALAVEVDHRAGQPRCLSRDEKAAVY